VNLAVARLLRSSAGGVGVALLIPLVAVPVVAFGQDSQQRILIGFLINLVVVVGLQVFMGNSGITMLGHTAFMGIGAYTAGILATPAVIKLLSVPRAPFGVAHVQLGVVATTLAALGLVVVVAFVTGLAVTRQSDIPAAIATLALLIIYHTVVVNWLDLTRGPRAFYGVPVRMTVWVAAAIAAAAVIVARLFRDSPTGLQLRASSQDQVAAAAMGVDVRRTRLAAWVLSGALSGVGGACLAFHVGTLHPSEFYFNTVFLTLAMLLIGGKGSVSGAVVGTLVITLGNELMRALESGPHVLGVQLPQVFGLTQLFLGAIIIVVMKFRPGGLLGDHELDELLRSVTTRRRLEVPPRDRAPKLENVTGP
jgi:branched-chain amino acid transport system permease protein